MGRLVVTAFRSIRPGWRRPDAKSPSEHGPRGSSARGRVGGGPAQRLNRRLLAGVVEAPDHIAAVVGVPDAPGADAVAAIVAVIVVPRAVVAVVVGACQRRAEGEAGQAGANAPAPSAAAPTAAAPAATVPVATVEAASATEAASAVEAATAAMKAAAA